MFSLIILQCYKILRFGFLSFFWEKSIPATLFRIEMVHGTTPL